MKLHPWARTDRPLVFAHRGGGRLAPENTLAAFDRAMAESVDGIELDVRLSRDGEVVVCHDPRLDRTCDATGPVAGMTATELACVDAGYWFSPSDGGFPYRGQGLGIPRLREVLARYSERRLIVEMKDDGPAIAGVVLEVLREANAIGRVCLGSFHRDPLDAARRLDPNLVTSASQNEVAHAVVCSHLGFLPPFRRYGVLQVPEDRNGVRVVSPRFVRAAHRGGVAVQVWVVDRIEDIRRLLDWGADALITDRPDTGVTAVREWWDARREVRA